MTIYADYTSRWFDLERLLDETFIQEIEFHRECTSTNDLALSTAADWKSPTLLLTDSQTGGRGRGSNQWWARDGALTFSLRMTPAEFAVQHERWPLVSLTSAIAVADTLEHFAPGHQVGLKWPNDVFLDNRKVSGILVEPPRGSNSELVIGVGINVVNSLSDAPDDVRSIATSILDATDTEHSPDDVLLRFLQRFESLVRELGGDRLNLRERWQKQCTLTGQRISLESGDHLVSGLCSGIADNGALQIQTDGVVRSWFGGIVRSLE